MNIQLSNKIDNRVLAKMSHADALSYAKIICDDAPLVVQPNLYLVNLARKYLEVCALADSHLTKEEMI